MRHFLLAPLIIFAFFTCHNSNNNTTSESAYMDTSFSLMLSYSFQEKSMDSYSYSNSFSIQSGILAQDYESNRSKEVKQKKLNLTAKTLNRIKQKIEELNLYQNYHKEFPVEPINSVIIKTDFSLSIKKDSLSYNIYISGSDPSQIQDKVYSNLSLLSSFFDSLLKK